MAFSRKAFFSIVFSVAALGLGGCGGGSSNPAAPAAGACPTGMTPAGVNGQCVSISSATANCQRPNQGPMVYGGPQYGCLSQGNCNPGQGMLPTGGCIQGQMGAGISGCADGQLMTEKGCLPLAYQCGPNAGFLQGRCYAGANGEVLPHNQNKTIPSDEVDSDSESDDDYVVDEYYEQPVHSGYCVKIKHRAHGAKIKIKTRGRCRR